MNSPTNSEVQNTSSSTPLTPRVSELKQIWEETIRKHEESVKSASFKIHSVACLTNNVDINNNNNTSTVGSSRF